MRICLVFSLLLGIFACKTALKPKHFIGEYTFATGDDFIAPPDGCLFAIDSALNFWFCPSFCGFWENPLRPKSKTTLRFQVNQLLENDPDTRGKYVDAEAYFADPQTAITFKAKQKEAYLLKGSIAKNSYTFAYPRTVFDEIRPRIWKIVQKEESYILRIEMVLKDSPNETEVVERELKKLK